MFQNTVYIQKIEVKKGEMVTMKEISLINKGICQHIWCIG